MERKTLRTILVHISAWGILILYHILSGLTLSFSLKHTILVPITSHLFIYIPIFYLVYFFALKPFEKTKNMLLFAGSVSASFFIYTVICYIYYKYFIPAVIPTAGDGKFSYSWGFIVSILDLFFLYYFLYALLYWYAERNLRTQKMLREKEAQAFKTRQQMQELEGMALRAQMNPHFIFNSLNSVQYFIVDKDMETANRYLGRFGQLIRQTLDNSAQSMISLEQEKNYLVTYLELEQMRMPGTFDYTVTVAPGVEPEQLFLPAMLLQPYVENAVKHGMMHKTGGSGKIDIMMNMEQDRLLCRITDNGQGRAATQALKKNTPSHQSKGMTITEERIELLNKNQGAGIRYAVTDLKNENGVTAGTCIEIRFPVNFVQNKPRF